MWGSLNPCILIGVIKKKGGGMENIKLLVDADIYVKEGKRFLLCESAHKIAKENSIPLKEIGDYCTKDGIKIASCQLGCF